MKTSRLIFFLILSLLSVIATSASSEEKKAGLKQTLAAKPEWQSDNILDQLAPHSLGILVINYEDFRMENGEAKEYLDPKITTETARLKRSDYFSYKPSVANDSLAQLINQSIVTQVKAIIPDKITMQSVVMIPGKTIQDGIDSLKANDFVLVLAINNPRASIVSFFAGPAAGQKFSTVNMPMNFVLLSRERTPLMTYSAMSMENLETVEKMSVGYDKAQPFKEQVSYRYTLDALVKATAPIVTAIVKEPFLSTILSLKDK